MSDLVATNITDTVRTFPLITHGYLAPYFHDLFDKASKYFSAKHAVEEFERMKVSGTLPTSLNSLRVPTLQVSADYKSQPSSINGAYVTIEAETKKFRNSALDLFIAAKKEEKNWYQSEFLAHNALEGKRVELVNRIATGLRVTHGVQKNEDLPDNILENAKTFEDMYLIGAHHIIELARNKALKSYENSRRKRKSKAAADVEMTDLGGALNGISLEKAVAKVMKAKEQSRRDKKKNDKKSTSPFWYNYSSYELTTSSTTRKQNQERVKIEKALPSLGKRKRSHFEVKEVQEAACIINDWHKRARLDRVFDYPDSFFSASLKGRVLFLQSKMPIIILNSLRISNYPIFQAPHVSLPIAMRYFLAVNAKYIFPQKLYKGAAMQSYSDLMVKMRTWLHFHNNPRTFLHDLPEYLNKVRTKTPFVPDAPQPLLESALGNGRDVLLAMLEKVIPTSYFRPEPEPILTGLFSSRQALTQELLLKQYMVFPTDKNLGLAVVSGSWYQESINNHLSLDSYQRIAAIPWDWLRLNAKKLARSKSIPPDFSFFLSENLPRKGDTYPLPNFHGIPKVHKNPWKIRPIVPLYDWVSTRLAMVVHYYLNPLLSEFPWICTSSKQFTRNILIAFKGRDFPIKICSADVVGMYTNIQTDALLLSLRRFLKSLRWDDSLIHFLVTAVRFINDSVIFSFDNQIYWQQSGIAMGAACSPVLANIFMGIWERDNNIPSQFLYYTRYIDDVLAVTSQQFQGTQDSPPGLELEWSSGESSPFLDTFVHVHGNQLCVKPYTKPLNHYQYIPFNSAHPLHVKKALVKTELIRFASTAALPHYYDERKKKLYSDLRARGYPERALKAWIRQVSWKDPSSTKKGDKPSELTPRPPLFVRSEYNPVWKYVKFRPIWEEMIESMVKSGLPTPPFSHPVLSLNRSTNMLDVLRRSNKAIIHELDDEPRAIQDHDTDIIVGGTQT